MGKEVCRKIEHRSSGLWRRDQVCGSNRRDCGATLYGAPGYHIGAPDAGGRFDGFVIVSAGKCA
jgi:hypothetical protein